MKLSPELEGIIWSGTAQMTRSTRHWMPKPFTPEYADWLLKNVSFVASSEHGFLPNWKKAWSIAEDGFVLSCADIAYALTGIMRMKRDRFREDSLGTSTIEIASLSLSNNIFPTDYTAIIFTSHGNNLTLHWSENHRLSISDSAQTWPVRDAIARDIVVPKKDGAEVFRYDKNRIYTPTTGNFGIAMLYDEAQAGKIQNKMYRELKFINSFRSELSQESEDYGMPLAFARAGLNAMAFDNQFASAKLLGKNYFSVCNWMKRTIEQIAVARFPDNCRYEAQPIMISEEMTYPANADTSAHFAIIRKPRGESVQKGGEIY